MTQLTEIFEKLKAAAALPLDSSPGYVYLLKSGTSDFYRIGFTRDPDGFIRTLQQGNPEELHVLYVSVSTSERIVRVLRWQLDDMQERGSWFCLEGTTSEELRQGLQEVIGERQARVLEEPEVLDFDDTVEGLIDYGEAE